jgi:DNA-binding beta-propeller fold protein YncE
MLKISKVKHSLSPKSTALSLALGLCLGSEAASAPPCDKSGDTLYISDITDNTVAIFDVETGTHLGDISVGDGNVARAGIIHPSGRSVSFVVQIPVELDVDLEVELDVELERGEVLRFRTSDGEFLGELVSSDDPNAPLAPRGILLGKRNELFITSVIGPDGPGRIAVYSASTGSYIEDFDTEGLDDELHPQGLVVGPDGDLYVSNTNWGTPEGMSGGSILRFDPKTHEFINVVADESCCTGELELHRPDAAIFGPDDRLYVTTFRDPADPTNTADGILIFEIDDGVGTLVDELPLYVLGKEPRAYAHAALTGPDDRLYVPISGGDPGADVGAVRAYEYNPKTMTWEYETFIPASEPGLGAGYCLTFGGTNPTTLLYEWPKQCER